MNLPQLDILEAKILQSLEMIRRLRDENRELKELVASLQLQLEEKDRAISRLHRELTETQNAKFDNSYYQEREAHIRGKVEAMLAKLEALELPM